jgi:hypothetical protein
LEFTIFLNLEKCHQPVSSEAAKPKQAAKNKKAKEAAGAPHIKLDSFYRPKEICNKRSAISSI